jgi:hypothetical protein
MFALNRRASTSDGVKTFRSPSTKLPVLSKTKERTAKCLICNV